MADVTSTFAAKDVGFSATVNRMQRTLADFQSGIAGFGMKVAGLAATFVSVQAVMSAFRDGLDMAGRLNDLSKTTGETAGNLATLERAFENNGMAAEQVGVSIAKMSEFLVGLRSGSESASKAAAAMGISLSDLAGKTPIEQMQAIMQAIAGIRDPALRTATAVDVFGRSGRAVIPLASEFSGEIANARSELGSLVPILDANSASLDQLGDKLQNAVGNKLNELAIGFAAGITGANNFVDALAKIDAAGFGKQLGDSLRIAFDAPLETAKAIGYTLLTGAKKAGNALINAAMFAGEVWVKTVSASDYIAGLGKRLEGAVLVAGYGFIRVMQEGIERIYKLFAQLPGPFGAAARNDLKDIEEWQGRLNARIKEGQDALADGARLIKGSIDNAVNSTEILAKDWLGVEQSAADAARHLLDAEQRSNTIRENAEKTAENFGKGSAALRDALAEIRGFDLKPKLGPEERPDWTKSNQPPPPAPAPDNKGGGGGGGGGRMAPPKPKTAQDYETEMRAAAAAGRYSVQARDFQERGFYAAAARAMERADKAAQAVRDSANVRSFLKDQYGAGNMGEAYEKYRRMTGMDRDSREEFERKSKEKAKDFNDWSRDQSKSKKQREEEGQDNEQKGPSGGSRVGAIETWLKTTFFTEFKQRLPQHALI